MKQGEIEEGKIRAPNREFQRSDCLTVHKEDNEEEEKKSVRPKGSFIDLIV